MTEAREQVAVLGAGYVGLVTAVGLAGAGHDITLVEKEPDRLASLAAGQVPIFEAGLQEAYERAVAAGRITVGPVLHTTPGIVMVCVGTPISDDGRSDLSQLKGALADLDPLIGPETVLVIRSTLPVGVGPEVSSWSSVPSARIFTNPEFLRQGSALADFQHPARVVVGRFMDTDEAALRRVLSIVSVAGVPTMVVDLAASELIKNGANAFLALKLSFANELAALSEEAGTDIGDVLAGITADPRIGPEYLRPGFGFGGSCLPKELQTLAVAGRAYGLAMHVTTAASQANIAHQDRFADRIARLLGGLRGRRVGVLGLAFKAGTDDIRSSPALRLARALVASGADVRAFDPAASHNARRAFPALQTVDAGDEVFPDADAVVVATEWPEFRQLDFGALRAKMAEPLIIDGRRLLDVDALRQLGFRVAVLGTSMSGDAVPANRNARPRTGATSP